MGKELHDLVVIEVETNGPVTSVLEKAVLQIEKKRQTQVFDVHGEGYKANFTEYTVTIHPEKKGKTSPKPRTEMSPKSFENAMARATRDGKVEYTGPVELKLVEKFRIPYDLVKARA